METAIPVFFRWVRDLSKVPFFCNIHNDILVSSEDLEHRVNEVTLATVQKGENEMGNVCSKFFKKLEVYISDFPSILSPSLNPLCNWQNENSFFICVCSKIGWDKIR